MIPGLVERLRAEGPIPFAAFMEAALYDPDEGFYATGGQAGRRGGHFLTSPEVGPLFGAVLARALDGWWEELGRPSPFTVVDAGAGPGTLARAVLAAEPAVLRAGALRYVMSERSSAQRAAHVDIPTDSTSNRWPRAFEGVVVANELLDNLPFRLAVFDGGWQEAFVDVDPDGRLVEVLRPFAELPACLPPVAPHGARAPVQDEAAGWVSVGGGRAEPGPGRRDRLRPHHGRDGLPPVAGVAADLPPPRARRPLPRRARHAGHHRRRRSRPTAPTVRRHHPGRLPPPPRPGRARRGGPAALARRCRRPDLAALAGRSRIQEAEALTEPDGLGGFTVAQWVVDQARPEQARSGERADQ